MARDEKLPAEGPPRIVPGSVREIELDLSWRESCLESLRRDPTIGSSLRAAGVSRREFEKHVECDDEFRRDVELARADGRDYVRAQAKKWAEGYVDENGKVVPPDSRVRDAYLKIHLDELRSTRTDLTSGGRPIGNGAPRVTAKIVLDDRSPVRQIGEVVELYEAEIASAPASETPPS